MPDIGVQKRRLLWPRTLLHPAHRGAGALIGRDCLQPQSRPERLAAATTRQSVRRNTRVATSAEALSWPILAAMSACASGGQLLQDGTILGRYVSAPLFALVLGFLCAAAGVLPLQSPAYDLVWEWLMPLATALFLLDSADLRQILREAGSALFAFGIASLGTILGTLTSWLCLGSYLGTGGWKVAAALCGSYIGGSLNFAAIALALQLDSGPLLAGAMAADIGLMALYLVIVGIIPAPQAEQNARAAATPAQHVKAAYAPPSSEAEAHGTQAWGVETASRVNEHGPSEAASAQSMALALTAATASCALGNLAAQRIGLPSASLAFVSVFATIFASVAAAVTRSGSAAAHRAQSPFLGANALGGALMLLFFVTIGAAAGSLGALLQTGWLAGFITLQLGVHMAFTLGLGRLFRLPMEVILTASNAAVGGPSTAAAMASGRNWTHMLRPAIVTGSLGYAVGNGIGCAVGHVMHVWPAPAL